jgi:hypothetical protein
MMQTYTATLARVSNINIRRPSSIHYYFLAYFLILSYQNIISIFITVRSNEY